MVLIDASSTDEVAGHAKTMAADSGEFRNVRLPDTKHVLSEMHGATTTHGDES